MDIFQCDEEMRSASGWKIGIQTQDFRTRNGVLSRHCINYNGTTVLSLRLLSYRWLQD